MKTTFFWGTTMGMLMLGGVACSAAPEGESLGEDQGAAGGGGSCVSPTDAKLAQAAMVMAGGEDVFPATISFIPADPRRLPYNVTVSLKVKGTPGDTSPLVGASAGCVSYNGLELAGTIARARFEVTGLPAGLPSGTIDIHDALQARNELYTNVFGDNSWSVPTGTLVPPILWAIDPLCAKGSSSKAKVFNHGGTLKRRGAGAGYTTVPNGYIVPTNVQPPSAVPVNGDGSEPAEFAECAGG